MTSINSELSRFAYIEYLKTFNASELAYWLINSFTPKRYYDKNDVIEWACKRMFELVSGELPVQFIAKLWEMHNETNNNVVSLRG